MIKKYAQMNKCMLEYTGKQNLSVDPGAGSTDKFCLPVYSNIHLFICAYFLIIMHLDRQLRFPIKVHYD